MHGLPVWCIMQPSSFGGLGKAANPEDPAYLGGACVDTSLFFSVFDAEPVSAHARATPHLSAAGFLRLYLTVRARKQRACMGRTQVTPIRQLGRRYAEGCNSHTLQAGFKSRGRGRLGAASRDTAQVEPPAFILCHGVGGGFAVEP